jgi:hypothetical protein
MRFNVFIVLGLASSAIASPLPPSKRDSRVIDASIKRVTNSLQRLVLEFKQRKPSSTAQDMDRIATALISRNRDLIQDLRFGSREIRRGPSATSYEALLLMQSAASITQGLQGAVNGWIDAKRVIVMAGRKAAVLDELIAAEEASDVFSDAMIAKLPVLNQPLAQQFKTNVNRIIDLAVADYKR